MGSRSIVLSTLTVVALVVLFASRQLRGVIRVRVASASVVLVLGLATLAGVSIAYDFKWNRADALNLVGLGIAISTALFAGDLLRGVRRIRVGVVIPSLRPFHREVREGIREVLREKGRYHILDPFVEGRFSEEDLSSFPSVLHEAIRKRCDTLVVCAPAADLANAPDVVDECKRFADRGGHIYFIESIPDDAILDEILFVTALQSDSQRSAQLLGDYVVAVVKADELANRILMIPGPQHSRPAQERLQELSKHISKADLEIVHTRSWTAAEAEAAVLENVDDLDSYAIICCGNDDMARGAARALAKVGRRSPPIVGHDGLYETLVLIADPFSPLSATVRIPPRAFGERVGVLIDSAPARFGCVLLHGRAFYANRTRAQKLLLPITRASLVTKHNADLLLPNR
jgi:ABC-type sugar transport system substrate-binding protein